jgi:hypothetical protein
MKRVLFFFFLSFGLSRITQSQIVCIQCFDQNDPISPLAVNRLQNGGFEETNCIPGWLSGVYCPNSDLYNCDIAHWTCTGGGAQSYPSIFDSTLCLIPQGLYAAYFGNGNAFACVDQSFDTSCLERKLCTVAGFPAGFPTTLPGYGGPGGVSLEQTVSGLTIGEQYVLEFWAGGEPLQGLLSAPGIFAVDVGFGKSYLNCKPTGGNQFRIGTVYLIRFIASAASHTIKFTNWGHTCIDCTELVIDNVSIYTLAELSGSIEDCMTGLEEVSPNEVSIYPNPAIGEIEVKGMEEDYILKLMDAGGRLLPVNVLNNKMDVTLLPAGIYYIMIVNRKDTMVKMLVKL